MDSGEMHRTRMWQKTTKMAILFIIFALIVPNIPNPLTIVQIAKGDPGSNIYVATTGNDATGNGSIGNPYRTIQKGVNMATAGDTVCVRGGNYNEYVRITASGTSGHPITIRGYNNERAVIDGTGITLPSGGALVMLFNSAGNIGYDYITIENMYIQNSTKVGLRTSFSVANPSNNIIINNCSFYNIVYNAIAIWEDDVVSNGHCENITVKNCIFDNIQTGMNAGECVTFVGCKNVLFQNNTLSRTHKTGADFATNSEDIIIDNNTFDTTDVQNWGSGLYLDGSQKTGGAHINNVTISNNYFYGTKSGIKLCCEIGSTLSSLNNITIVNNVFNIDCATSLTDGAIQICTNDGTSYWHAYDITIKYNTIYVSAGDWSADACVVSDLTETYVHTWVIANNILISGKGTYPNYQLSFKFTKAESDLVRENNLYYKVGGTASCHFSDDAGNDCLEASAVDDNPDIVSLGTNFHLNATSPAIDAGSSAYTTPYDFDGNPRPHGVGYDIGAYEYAGYSIYVATTGNDITGTGSIGNPYETIQKACNVSGNGDTVYVMAGIYTPTNQIIISNKNTANEWLTISNYNDDYVEINGSNCPSGAESNVFDSVIELNSCKYVRITGLAINHSAQGGITLKATCSFITVDNCSINNCSVFAIKSFAANNITFEHNFLYNNFNNWSATVVGQETISFEGVKTFSINNNTLIANRHLNIDVKDGCKNGEICYNEINTTAGHVNIAGQNLWGSGAIYLDARGVSSNISIFNNNMYGNNTGIELNTETSGHFEYIYVYNNIANMSATGGAASSSGRGAIGLANTGYSSDTFHHIYIYSNTFVNGVGNVYGVLQVGHYTYNQLNSSNLHDVYIANNIFYGSYTTLGYSIVQINKISFEDGVFILNNNSYYRPSGAIKIYWNGTSYNSSANPGKFGTDPVFTDPSFVHAYDDFHLNSTSPCIDTGNSTLVPSFDFDDVSRPQGAGYDIGAFEFLAPAVYTFNPITTFRVLPNTPMPDEYLSDEMLVTSCPGEYTAATFVVTPKQHVTALLPTADDLTCGELAINKSYVDIKVVKCWYQRGDDTVPSSPMVRLYLPELLLNDDNLIRTTYISNTSGWNQLNTTAGYVNINNRSEGGEYAKIYDSATLLPVDVPTNTNKQFWVTVHVPDGATAGKYNGLIHLMSGSTQVGQVNLTVKVLPFTLPVSPIINSIYYTQVLPSNNTASLNAYGRNQTQLYAEMKGMKEHGILYPAIDGQNYISNASRFDTFMKIWAAEGLHTDKMFYASSSIGYSTYFNTIPLIDTNVPKVINYFKDNYSANDVYFYAGLDEHDVVPYAAYILESMSLGAKTMNAQARKTATAAVNYNPPLLNMSIMAGHPDATIIARYHGKNLSIGSYGNPQAGEEKPLTYRTNYGLLLWQYGVDVASTFAYAYGNSTAPNRLLWNDWNWRYKAEVFAYPTTNGVVNTIEYEGFREGVNDVRYLAKLEAVCQQAKSEGREMYDAEAYIANLKNWNITVPSEIDVAQVRSEVISYIEEYYGNLTTHLVSPKTQTTAGATPDCILQVNDVKGHSLTVNFYENSTGSWIQKQKNTTSANSTVRWIFTQALSPGVTYWWKATVYDGITSISHIYSFKVEQSLPYGTISDSIISTYTGDDSPSAVSPYCVRINSSEYYLVASSFAGNVELNTLRICNYSGRIQQNIISWYILGSAAGSTYPIVVQVPHTDKYAIVYRDALTKKIAVATVKVWDTNGTIQQSVIDFQALTYNGYDANMIAVTDNVFVIAYYHNVSHDGYLETIWINQSGTINDTILSTVQYSTAQGASPHMLLLDSDTIALNYVSPGTDGNLTTYNITSSGIITSTYSDNWEYEKDYCWSTSIAKVSGDVYAISYSGQNKQYYGNIKTLTINSTTGKITKSFIDTQVFDANDANYSTLLKIQPGVFAIAYKGTGGIGMIKTVNITDTGQIDNAPIDSLVFDATKCTNYAYMTYVSQSYYFIVYERYWYTGFGSTVTIETNYTNPLTIIASSQVDEKTTFTITVESAVETLVEGATVNIFGSNYLTNLNGQVSVTAPSVSSDTTYTITATKTRYTAASSTITVKNIDAGGGSGPGLGGPSGLGEGDTTPPAAPKNVRCTTSATDNTPSFTWNASTDESGIAGYYVKIDNGTTTWVGNVLTWTSANVIADGTHTFYVKAKDNSSNKNNGTYGSCSFTINTTTVGKPPVADANGPYSEYVNTSITFNASESYDIDGNITSYEWNFGDGNTGNGISPTHIYSKIGNYTLVLTVTDNQGLTNSTVTYVSILENKSASEVKPHKNTPGFELVVVVCAIALVLLLKRKKRDL